MIFDFKPKVPAMTHEEVIKQFIDEFDKSNERKAMLEGERYYKNKNDINDREIFCYIDKVKTVDLTKPNNKLSHAFMKLLIDEKIGYFLGTAPNIVAENKDFQEKLINIFDDGVDELLNDIGVEASNKGIAWMQMYFDEKSKLKFMKIPSEQIIPIWADSFHKKLKAVIRYYYATVYEGKNKKNVLKVEYWDDKTLMYYTEYNGKLIPDVEANRTTEAIGHYVKDNKQHGWGKVPFIYFKNNSNELNDLNYVKSIIDNYDLITSDTSNTLEEIQNLIYVLKGYGGEELSEFMKDLKYNKAIKIDADEGAGVDTLNADLNIDAVEKHLDRLKRDIYQFGQGVNMDTDKFGANPSGVALKFLYSGLSLKVDQMERKFKSSFKQLFWFISQYLKITDQGNYDPLTAKVIFHRSTITNDLELIESVNTSTGVISKKTSIAHHPWVDDVLLELKQLEKERKKDEEVYPNFPLEEPAGSEDNEE